MPLKMWHRFRPDEKINQKHKRQSLKIAIIIRQLVKIAVCLAAVWVAHCSSNWSVRMYGHKHFGAKNCAFLY